MTRPAASPRDTALEVVRHLVDHGHIAYFAGGCVRDKLLGHEPKDYDIATDAHPPRISELFRNARGVGEAFGVMLVRRQGMVVEVATFRTDGTYLDGRHPVDVAFTDAEHDARRRDFTINGLFEDPLENRIIDYVGGQADIDQRVVRAIGDPEDRMREDRLRMLRAVRFAARFGFSLEAETADTIREGAGALEGVSRERIGQEIRMMLVDQNRAVAAWELQYLGLDEPVLGEPSQLSAPRRLGRLPVDVGFATSLAAWFLDRHGHADPARFAAWSTGLVLSNAENAGLRRRVTTVEQLRSAWWHAGVASQKRLAAEEDFIESMKLLAAEDATTFVRVRRRVLELEAAGGLAPPPLLTGDDLTAAGFSPGPAFGDVLRSVYDAQLEGQIEDPGEAMALARRLLGSV